jgi:photosystem II stability/assembly factor-like uncharacterized protein
MTRDGGHTWRFQTISLPADVPRSEAAWQGAAWSWPPVFVSPNNGVMLVGQVPGPHSLIAYTTADGGQTWQPHKIDANPFNPLGPPDFVDVHTGWFVAGSLSSGELQLFVTHDGGQTWASVKSNVEPGVDVDFIDGQRGWSWSPDGLLLETEDGGTTWNPINPQLITS